MDWGMENRLARIVKPIDGKAVMLAVDHGYFLGPTEKLENPRKTVEPLVKYCDSLMLTRGIQRSCVDPKHLVPIVLRVSGGSSIIGILCKILSYVTTHVYSCSARFYGVVCHGKSIFSGIFLPPAIMTGTGHEFTTFSKSLQWYVFTMRAPCSAAILHASER